MTRHLRQCFIQQPIRRKGPNTDYDNEKEDYRDSAEKTKKADEESSPLPEIDRDTEQAVQDNALRVFDIEMDQSCEQNHNHKTVLLCAKTLSGDQILAHHNFVHTFFGDLERVRKWGRLVLSILEEFYEQQQCIPKIFSRGNKVISMKVGNMRFIDSFLFIPIALCKFAKTFELTEI